MPLLAGQGVRLALPQLRGTSDFIGCLSLPSGEGLLKAVNAAEWQRDRLGLERFFSVSALWKDSGNFRAEKQARGPGQVPSSRVGGGNGTSRLGEVAPPRESRDPSGLCILSDERDAVQKKTFTKWVNSHLAQVSCRVSDLYTDLRDGYILTKLLEVLSGEQLVRSGEASRSLGNRGFGQRSQGARSPKDSLGVGGNTLHSALRS